MTEPDYVNARWRKPVVPMGIKEETGWGTSELGRPTLEYSARFSPDDIERIRLGYVCIRCWEPHQDTFPEQCSLCGFPMRDKQRDEFAQKFQGVERDPRAVSIEKGLDRVDDTHERRFHIHKPGIIVPTLKLKEK